MNPECKLWFQESQFCALKRNDILSLFLWLSGSSDFCSLVFFTLLFLPNLSEYWMLTALTVAEIVYKSNYSHSVMCLN